MRGYEGRVLQDLYNSQINFQIETDWGNGFWVRIMDQGECVAETLSRTLEDAVE